MDIQRSHGANVQPSGSEGHIEDFNPASALTPALSNNTNQPRTDLWKEAVAQLERSSPKEAKVILADFELKSTNDDIIGLVLKQATEVREKCDNRGLKSTEGNNKKKGDAFDKIHKVINSVMKFKALVDAGLQFDPSGYGTIAWTVTSFCLQMAINYEDKRASILEGAEILTHLVARYALIEAQYLGVSSNALTDVKRCVIDVYEAILVYLAEVKDFTKKGLGRRILKSFIPLSDSGLQKLKDAIQSRDSEVDKWTKLIENECRTSQYKELRAKVETLILPIYQTREELTDINNYVQRKNRQDVLDWISTLNPSAQHKSARDRAVGIARETPGIWVLDEPEYRYWQSSLTSALLWLSGDLGTGKTILTSTIIEHIKHLYGGFSQGTTAYFYCSGTTSTSADSILQSILRQFAESRRGLDIVATKWEKSSGKELLTRSDVVELIKSLVNVNCKTQTTIIIDGLDEMNPSDICDLIEVLDGLLQINACLVKILLSSRPETQISYALARWPRIDVIPAKTKEDIDLYINTEVERRLKYKPTTEQMKANIKLTVRERAKGMFTYVVFAIEFVCSSLGSSIETALNELPEELEHMYEKLFERVEKDRERSLAKRSIMWLSQGKEPLPSQHFIAAICFGLGKDPASVKPEEILTVCHHLVNFNKEDDHFDFRHFSVLEFIRKGKLEDYTPSKTHLLLAETCLSNLVQDDFIGHYKSERQLDPLTKYAITYWAFHCQYSDLLRISDESLNNLFYSFIGKDTATAAFQAWRRAFSKANPRVVWDDETQTKWRDTDFEKGVLRNGWNPSSISPFSVACVFNFWDTIESLAPVDVDCLNLGVYVASKHGNERVAKLLLEKDADPNFPCKPRRFVRTRPPSFGQTPLLEAARNGHNNLALLLLEFGAKPNLVFHSWPSALYAAAEAGHVSVVKTLLDWGADVNYSCSMGRTPLHRAAAGGHELVVKLLLEKGSDPGIRSTYCRSTPLELAARYGSQKMVYAILEKGVDIKAQNDEGDTPLHLASKRGDVSVVEFLLKNGCELDVQDDYGWTALHRAAGFGHAEVAQLLLENMTSVDVQDKEGRTALYLAAQGWHESVVSLLLESDADPNIRDRDARTPLHAVVDLEIGRRDPSPLAEPVVRLLLENEADLHLKDKNGRTALHNAAIYGLEAVFQLLLDKGADISGRDKDGRTPLHSLIVGRTPLHSLIALSKREKKDSATLRRLIEGGADIRTTDNQRRTMLHDSAQRGSVAHTQLLIAHGADINAKDDQERTALHEAAINGHDAVIQLLVEMGANVTAFTSHGETALHVMAREGNKAIVELLIAKGAVINAKDNEGKTALFRAAWNEHEAVLQLLIEKSADVKIANNCGETVLHLMAYRGNRAMVELLIVKGAVVNAKDDKGRTALHRAAENGHEAVLQLLIEKGADVAATDEHNETVLHLMAYRGNGAIVELLIVKGAVVGAKDDKGRTALHRAAENGHEGVVQMLIERGADIAASDEYGDTVLCLMAYKGNNAIIDFLIQKGADIRSRNKYGRTALHKAALGGHTGLVQQLINAGVDISATDKSRRTALHMAADGGHEAMVRLLLEREVDVEASDEYGFTLLHIAVRRKNMAITIMLIENGAKIDARDRQGCTALHHAAMTGNEAAAELLIKKGAILDAQDKYGWTALSKAHSHEAVVRLLLKQGADPNIQNKHGQTSLYNMTIWGSLEEVKLLVAHGADVNIHDEDGKSAMHKAVDQEKLDVLSLLLKEGADPNSKDRKGRTLLHHAADRSSRGCNRPVQVLLANGADPNIQDNDGKTPLDIATSRKDMALVRQLLEKGAKVTAAE